MSKEERFLKIQNELIFGIETKDGTFYVPKDDIITIVSDLLDEVSQPQLTIPKSVAKQADKSSFNEMITLGAQAFYWWFDHEDDEYIPVIYAYLAGKALGVDLVKVV